MPKIIENAPELVEELIKARRIIAQVLKETKYWDDRVCNWALVTIIENLNYIIKANLEE